MSLKSLLLSLLLFLVGGSNAAPPVGLLSYYSAAATSGGDPAAIVSGSAATVACTNSVTCTLADFAVGNEQNRILIVIVAYDFFATPPTGATFGGDALTEIGNSVLTNYGATAAYYLVNPATTTANIAVTGFAADEDAFVLAIVVENANQATPIADFTNGFANAADKSVTVSNVAANDITFGSLCNDTNSATITTTTGNVLADGYNASWTAYGIGYNTGSGNVTIGWTNTAANGGWIGFRVRGE